MTKLTRLQVKIPEADFDALKLTALKQKTTLTKLVSAMVVKYLAEQDAN